MEIEHLRIDPIYENKLDMRSFAHRLWLGGKQLMILEQEQTCNEFSISFHHEWCCE